MSGPTNGAAAPPAAPAATEAKPSLAAVPISRRAPILGIALVIVPTALGVAFAKLGVHGSKSKDTKPARTETKEPTATTTIELPELIVNLAESKGQKYLKTRIAIELRTDDPEAARAKMAASSIALRDALIQLLSAKTLDIVDAPDAKEVLRHELVLAVNKTALGGTAAVCDKLYFMEFIVQ